MFQHKLYLKLFIFIKILSYLCINILSHSLDLHQILKVSLICLYLSPEL